MPIMKASVGSWPGPDPKMSRMMFADPGFVIAQFIEILHKLHIALDRERGIFLDGMVRRDKAAETHLLGLVRQNILHAVKS